MFYIADRLKDFSPVKAGFKSGAQANDWAKKNLPKDEVRLWGVRYPSGTKFHRYFVRMK